MKRVIRLMEGPMDGLDVVPDSSVIETEWPSHLKIRKVLKDGRESSEETYRATIETAKHAALEDGDTIVRKYYWDSSEPNST